MLNDVLFLPIVTTIEDDLGQIDEVEEYTRMVYCDKKSVSQTEFFNGGESGFKPQYVFIMNTLDYQNEKKLKYKDTIYDIYRTYERSDERIELYGMVKIHD